MKVVLVGPYPYPGQAISGGVERVIDTLMRELAHSVELSLVVPNAPADLRHEVAGIPIVYLRRTRGPAVLRFFTADARRVATAIRELNPDIVHYQGVAGLSRYVDRPGVLTVHGFAHRDILFKPAKTWLHRLLRRLASKLLEMVERRYRRQIGHLIIINPHVEDGLPDVAALHRYPVPNPVDPLYTSPSPITERRVHIVSAGRLGRLKNTTHAVRLAASILCDKPRAQAFFYGAADNPEYLEQCRQIAADHGVSERLHFPGNVDAASLSVVLDKASVYLTTSLQETAPVAIAEALARGVAVVAPQTHGMRYMIRESENGFFLPPSDDVAAGAAVLARALEHPWDRAAMARTAQDTYGPAQVALRTVAAYRRVIAMARTEPGPGS